MIRKTIRKIRSSRLYLEVVWQADALMGVAAKRQPRLPATHHVLLCASGGGNIGDQAMFESFIQNVDGEVAVITSSARSLVVPESDAGRVEVVEIPSLLSGLPVLRLSATAALYRQLRRAKSYSVVGADVMDGVYSPEQSVARISSVRCAIALGVPSRILGFSWSPKAAKTAKLAMRRIGGRARILARDPKSFERLGRDGVDGLEATTDTVFCLEGDADVPDVEAWIESERGDGRRVAVLNLSGLIARKVDLLGDYRLILNFLMTNSFSVLLLPHVIRLGDDDLRATNDFVATLADDTDHLFTVRHALRPRQIKRLMSKTDLVVTGRMHLAVLALSSEIPTVTLGTQGKVEGLYALLGIPSFCLNPSKGFAMPCIEVLQGIVTDPASASAPIRENLPKVIGSSRHNFSGL